jgi:hypothetical protein
MLIVSLAILAMAVRLAVHILGLRALAIDLAEARR